MPCAALAVALITACTPGSSQRGSGPEAQPTEETASMRMPVIHDFGVPGKAFGPSSGTRVSDGAREIPVGRRQTGIFAIRRPSIPASCIKAAQFRLYIEKYEGFISAQLAIYPSHVFNALTKRDGDEFGYAGSVLDIRPRATLDTEVTGWSRWDVTNIVKTWVGRRPFPSQGIVAPRTGPIVLTMRDVDGATPFATATVASLEAAAHAPHLVLSHTKDCRAD